MLRYVYNTLKTQGCAETDSIMLELKTKYEETALELNTRLTEEFRRRTLGLQPGNFTKTVNTAKP